MQDFVNNIKPIQGITACNDILVHSHTICKSMKFDSNDKNSRINLVPGPAVSRVMAAFRNGYPAEIPKRSGGQHPIYVHLDNMEEPSRWLRHLLLPSGRSSEDVFSKVIDAFKVCKEKGIYNVDAMNAVLKELVAQVKSSPELYERDYPIYITISFLLSCTHEYMSQCDEADNFVGTCIRNLECMALERIASSIKVFLAMPYVVTYYELLRSAFLHFATQASKNSRSEAVVVSVESSARFTKHTEATRVLPSDFMHHCIIWVSLALECHSKLTANDSSFTLSMWNECFIKHYSKIVFDKETVDGIRAALKFYFSLELPQHCQIPGDQFIFLAEKGDIMRPFVHMRNYLDSLLQWDLLTPTHMVALYGTYEKWLQNRAVRSSLEKNTRTFEEGLALVELIGTFYVQKHPADASHLTTIQKWLNIILPLIDVTRRDAVDSFKLLFCGKYKVPLQHRDYLSCQIVAMVRKHFKDLSADRLLHLYTSLNIWPQQFLCDYLIQCKITHVVISDNTWQLLFQEVVSSKCSQECILTLIKSICSQYKDVELICEMLKINVIGLFEAGDLKIRKEFIDFFKKYIRSHVQSLLKDLPVILDAIPSHITIFHKLVLDIIYEMVYSELDKSIGQKDSSTLQIIKTKIMNSPLCPCRDLCWKIMTAYCETIHFSSTNLLWMQKHLVIIESVGEICHKIGRKHQTNADVSKCFDFLRKVHAVLATWRTNLERKQITYDDLLQYANCYSSLISVVNALHSESELLLELETLQTMQNEFMRQYEQLNILLIRYVPGYPEWCTLSSLLATYGISFSPDIQSSISRNVLYPGRNATSKLQCNFTPNYTGQFTLKMEDPLCIIKEMVLQDLISLNASIIAFLCPISAHMDILVFFQLQTCKLFSNYLRVQLQRLERSETVRRSESVKVSFLLPFSPGSGTECFGLGCLQQAVAKTKTMLYQLLDGTAKYSDMTCDFSFDLTQMDVVNEVNVLSRFFSLYEPQRSQEGLLCISDILQLLKASVSVQTIRDVCMQYQLTGCLADPQLDKLITVADSLSQNDKKADLTPAIAAQELQKLCSILCLSPKSDFSCFKLFSAATNSAEFHKFIIEKKFVGPKGRQAFQQQYQLVTAQLQHEQYNDTILNHLYAAYELIVLFTDPNQSLHDMMSAIATINDICAGLKHLETVNANISQIYLWFSSTEEDSMQVLETIVATGCYECHLDSQTPEVHLCFKYAQASQHSSDENVPLAVKWNMQEVNEFIGKLGFTDSLRDVKCRIKHFYHIHEIARIVANLYFELKSFGHPDFVSVQCTQFLQCSANEKDADGMVEDLRFKAQNWSKQITFLHSQHKWLLFFPIPKILRLYNLIKTTPPDITRIVQEVSILTSNTLTQQVELSSRVQPAASAASLAVDSDPIETVGVFLDIVFNSHALPIPRVQTLPTYDHSQIILHRLHGCSNAELIQLIVTIYDGIPEPFEVFYCHTSPTEEELHFFIERTQRFSRHYIMIEVNKLPFHLQEYLLHIGGQLKSLQQGSCIHLVESAPSMLGEIPGVLVKDGEGLKPMKDVKSICWEFAAPPEDLGCVQLVYGNAGNGKTYCIMKQLLKYKKYAVIAINEAFTPLLAINKLRALQPSAQNCCVYFNVTLLPQMSENNKNSTAYTSLMKVISWFFFDLLILGYVEDRKSGLSFRMPRGLTWLVYIEVPFYVSPEESQCWFKKEIPTLELLGSLFTRHEQAEYCVKKSVQTVCKYLNALKSGDIDKRSCKDGIPVKFSADPDLTAGKCIELLRERMLVKNHKIIQRLFIKYMKRRCDFIEKIAAFTFNAGRGLPQGSSRTFTDTSHLGSTLMEAMLSEVRTLCNSDKTNWSSQQLVYDCLGGGGSISLITLYPEKLTEKEREKFSCIGISISELHSAKVLHELLSRALGIPLNSKKCLTAIVESNYVLTPDYTLKMLDVNERWKCGIPVIIEGETGVGKTALVEMLSKLWNSAILSVFKKMKDDVIFYLEQTLGELEVHPDLEKFLNVVEALSSGGIVTHDDILLLCNLQHYNSKIPLYVLLYKEVVHGISKHKRLIPLLQMCVDYKGPNLEECLMQADEMPATSETIANVLHALFSAQVKSTFFKVNVHASLTPNDIRRLLQPAFARATELKSQFDEPESVDNMPFVVTIFFDEINASSCPGLFKEIIVDKTLEGEPIPSNLFIVAACNPHRGNSLAFYEHSWVKGSYSVHQLHPTLDLLKWDYGSLNEVQESDYIREKLKLLNKTMTELDVFILTSRISKSQMVIRDFAMEHLIRCGSTEDQARVASKSCVSQRDIQRVITFYEWLMRVYNKYKQHGKDADYHQRAVIVAIGVAYYMRLDLDFRKRYREQIDKCSSNAMSFSNAFQEELDWFTGEVYLPPGIARTEALKENLFAVIICTATHTPLIIVGPPGSSKTLSFNLVISNLKGKESKSKLFRNAELFPCLTPYYYQCSRQSTSSEIDTVFQRAISRQNKYSSANLQMYCVVCIDEAGLPDERHESLKVLHYYLDNPEVSFVATSNHMLDAAKTNRAVTLFRSEMSKEDLITLAKGCFYNHCDVNPPFQLGDDTTMITQLCYAYGALMTKPAIKKFFGLRDFIYFIYYLRNHRRDMLSPQVIMEGLERNFNGSDHFTDICKAFLPHVYDQVRRQNIVDIIRASIQDTQTCKEQNTFTGDEHVSNEVRYKLFIDASEDESLMRFLFAFNILKQETTKYICTDHSADHSQKVSTIATVRKYMAEGYTVVMSQADAIHESFYDLFNQRFRRIDDPTSGIQYYANVAIGDHTKPCKVHPHFQCVLVIKKSDVEKTAAPLLNRFEKYFVTHSVLLEAALKLQPPCLREIVLVARNKVQEFATAFGGNQSFCGFQESSSVDSLVLSMLPLKLDSPRVVDDGGIGMMTQLEPGVLFLHKVVVVLRRSGFSFSPHLTDYLELTMDTQYLLQKVQNDNEFEDIDIDNLTEQSVHDGVSDGFTVIFEGHSHATSGMGRLAIKLTALWLTLYMCKRLMQLVTTTGLITHLKDFPPPTIQSYLRSQAHFSLKYLQKRYILDERFCTSTKILCFSSCWTTSQLSIVPALQEIDPLHGSAEGTSITVNNLSHMPSESIHECLDQFVSSDKRILLLVANMDEVPHAKLNYVRILIEEAESGPSQQKKLFIILVGFPTFQLHSICYPSLFLNGWDHIFLHSLQERENGFNLRSWIIHCSTPTEEQSFIYSLRETIQENLVDLAPKVSHALTLVFQEDPLSLSKRTEQIKHLLLKTEAGSILCAKFVPYFEQGMVMKYLRKTVQFVTSFGVSHGILDSMQMAVLNDFTDFLIIMMSKVVDNCNFETLFQKYDLFQHLFLGMLQLLPVPEFTDISFLSGTLPSFITICNESFPFFKMIFEDVESVIDMYCDNDRSFSNDSNHFIDAIYHKVLQNVTEQLKKGENNIAKVFMTAIQNDELWKIYFDSFLFHKFKLKLHNSEQQLMDIIVKAYFGDFKKLTNVENVVWLHVYCRVQDVDLFEVIHILGQINIIHTLESNICSHFPNPKSKFPIAPSDVISSQYLSQFAIQVLFSYLVAASQDLQEKCGHSTAMTSWCNHYRDLMVATLGSHITSTFRNGPDTRASVAKLNIMQTVFMVLQFAPKSNNVAELIFYHLRSQHFDTNMELIAHCGLSSILHIIEGQAANLQGSDRTHVCRAIEGLLDHFFPCQKQEYEPEDIKCFFELANRQQHWCSFYGQAPVELGPYPHSLEMFKVYLSRILGDDKRSNPPGLQKTPARNLLWQTLARQSGVSFSQPFVPTFYTNLSLEPEGESTMTPSSPLAHLYFVTLLESFQTNSHTLPDLIKTADTIRSKRCTDSSEEVILLNIEFQVVLQAIIQRVAECLTPGVETQSDGGLRSEISILQDSINAYLSDPSRGGGPLGCHHLVLSLFLLKRLMSTCKFIVLMTTSYTAHCNRISCLEPIHREMVGLPTGLKLEFVLLEKDMLPHFETVRKILLEIHAGKKASAKNLIKQAHRIKSQFGNANLFCAMIWLAVYNDFFKKKISSSDLSLALDDKSISELFESQYCIDLIKCFLTQNKIGCDTHIYDLLLAQKESSDWDLRDCMANLIAVVICCSSTSHFWHHMFSPAKLVGTHSSCFVHGVKAAWSSASFSQQLENVYLQNVGLGTCTLLSFYFLLWIGFGGLCVSLLCQSETESICELLGSSENPYRYCVSRLKYLWRLIKDALSMSDEERTHLVNCVLKQIFQRQIISSVDMLEPGSFTSSEELKQFQVSWDFEIYQPALNTAKETFRKCESKLFQQLRVLNHYYPEPMRTGGFVYQIVGQLSLDKQKEDGEFHFLTKVAFEWARLKAGETILMQLVQFYMLLHSQLAHSLTFEEVQTITISDVLSKHVNLQSLYDKVKLGYNSYIEISERNKAQKIPPLQDRSLLVSLLSDRYLMRGAEFKDHLFTVISDICTLHNDFLTTVHTSQYLSHLVSTTKPPPSIDVYEVSDSCCVTNKHDLFHGIEELLPLMHRSCQPHHAVLPQGQFSGQAKIYDLKRFQEDIVLMYVIGKQKIHCSEERRKQFQLKTLVDESDLAMRTSVECHIAKVYPKLFLAPLNHSQKQGIEVAFHNANLSTMSSVIQGLQIAIELAAQCEDKNSTPTTSIQVTPNDSHNPELQTTSIMENRVFNELRVNGLSNTQEHVLRELPLCSLLSAMQLFIEWVQDGRYDFCELPIAFKSHMNEHDSSAIQQLDKTWKGDLEQLYEHLVTLNGALIFFQAKLAREPCFESQTIINYIQSLLSAEKQLQFINLIPTSITIQFYVSFALAVRRLLKRLANDLTKKRDEQNKIEKWNDSISDLWKRLEPHVTIHKPGILDTKTTSALKSGDTSTPLPVPIPTPRAVILPAAPIAASEPSGAEYSAADVASLLKRIGMDHHVESFRREEITGKDLLTASDGLLTELGVTSILERRKLRREFEKTIMTK